MYLNCLENYWQLLIFKEGELPFFWYSGRKWWKHSKYDHYNYGSKLWPYQNPLTWDFVANGLYGVCYYGEISLTISSYNAQGTIANSLTCVQLHKRAEKIAVMLMERGHLQDGDHVALVYPPGKAVGSDMTYWWEEPLCCLQLYLKSCWITA